MLQHRRVLCFQRAAYAETAAIVCGSRADGVAELQPPIAAARRSTLYAFPAQKRLLAIPSVLHTASSYVIS